MIQLCLQAKYLLSLNHLRYAQKRKSDSELYYQEMNTKSEPLLPRNEHKKGRPTKQRPQPSPVRVKQRK